MGGGQCTRGRTGWGLLGDTHQLGYEREAGFAVATQSACRHSGVPCFVPLQLRLVNSCSTDTLSHSTACAHTRTRGGGGGSEGVPVALGEQPTSRQRWLASCWHRQASHPAQPSPASLGPWEWRAPHPRSLHPRRAPAAGARRRRRRPGRHSAGACAGPRRVPWWPRPCGSAGAEDSQASVSNRSCSWQLRVSSWQLRA